MRCVVLNCEKKEHFKKLSLSKHPVVVLHMECGMGFRIED